MPVQNVNYDQSPALAVAGMPAFESEPRHIGRVILAVAMAAGLLAVQDTTLRTEGAPPSAPTAAPTAILATGGASSASPQTIVTTALNGAVGQGVISPAKNITLTFNSHADWDATTAVITGENEDGQIITESLAIPNGGNATVSGTIPFSRVTSIYIPAQTGTNGTFTAGTGTILGAVDNVVHGISLWDGSREPGVYAVDAVMPVIKRGTVWVYTEGAVNPSLPVFARFVASGDEVLGAFRGSPDSTDCGRVRAAKWLDITSGAGFARLQINLP